MTTGIVVGRFQTPELTAGHRIILSKLHGYDNKVVVIGQAPTRLTDRNPLPVSSVQTMIKRYMRLVKVHFLADVGYDNDQLWSDNLDAIASKYENPTLIGGRDSFIKHYKGKYPVVEIPEHTGFPSGTELRKRVKRSTSPLFAKGIIWSANYKFPTAYPTVDIAVVRNTYGGYNDFDQIVLGRKKGSVKWVLPGGFVDPTDLSLERAVKREAKEELGDIELGNPWYIGSAKVDDWRYHGTKDGIITSIFAVQYIFGQVKAGDDLEDAQWFTWDNAFDNIAPHHLELLKLIKSKI